MIIQRVGRRARPQETWSVKETPTARVPGGLLLREDPPDALRRRRTGDLYLPGRPCGGETPTIRALPGLTMAWGVSRAQPERRSKGFLRLGQRVIETPMARVSASILFVQPAWDARLLARPKPFLYLPVRVAPEIIQATLTVAASNDDAHESGGVVNISATDVDTNNDVSDWAGFRFVSGLPPAGSTILTATLELYINDATEDDVDANLYAEAAAAPAAFTTAANNISGRTRTTASVTWTGTGIGTGYQASPDIAAAIQEAIDTPGYDASALVVLFDALSAPGGGLRVRFWDYVPTGDFAARLNLTYVEGEPEPAEEGTQPAALVSRAQPERRPRGFLRLGTRVIETPMTRALPGLAVSRRQPERRPRGFLRLGAPVKVTPTARFELKALQVKDATRPDLRRRRGRVAWLRPPLSEVSLLVEQQTTNGIPTITLTIGSETLTGYIRAYHYEELHEARGYLAIWLDNRNDAFDDLAAGWPTLTRGAAVTLARGLVVDGSPLTAQLPRCWVESFEYLDDGRFLITCLDWRGRLETWRYATDTTWSASLHSAMISSLLGEVGLTLESGSFGYSTTFEASRFDDGDEVMDDIMDQVYEQLYAGLGGEILWKELDPAEASGYTYAFGANHPLLDDTEMAENSPRFNTIIANGGSELQYTATVAGATEAALTGTRRRVVENRNLSSNAECTEFATALLRQEQAEAVSASLVARPHFTLRLYDVVTYGAPPWGGAGGTGRVIEIIERCDLDDGTWEQELEVGNLFDFALSTEDENRPGRRRSRKARRKARSTRKTTRRSTRRSSGRGHHHDDDQVDGTIPIGCIVMWSGAVVPVNWALCDGTLGTPDLRDRFVIGAGTTYIIGDAGGATTANLAHTHGIGTLATANDTHNHTLSGSTASDAHTHGAGTIAADSDAHTHGAGTIAGASDNHQHSISSVTEVQGSPGSGVYVKSSATDFDAHTHTMSGSTASDAHTHTTSGSTASASHSHTAGTLAVANDIHNHALSGSTASGGSGVQSILNPYYALAFIMRIA